MTKKPFGTSIIYVILGLVFIALIGIRTISTPEIWTHLAQGRNNAPISFLEADSVVNTTHLYDKAVYGLWNMGGAPLLIIINVLGLLAAFILLIQVSKKWGGPLSQGFALLISGQLIFQTLDVSPQTLMMLFIALFVYLLTSLKKPMLLFAVLIPLQMLWTNMHGSFLFGPFIVAMAAIQAKQSTKINHRKNQQNLHFSALTGLALALLAVTLINPYFFELHRQVIANIQSPHPFYWASLFNEYFQIPDQKQLIFLTLILGAGGLITLKKRLPIMLTVLAILGAFFAWTSPRAIQLFAVLSFPFVVLSLSAVGEYLSGSFKTLLGRQGRLLGPITQIILLLLIILSLIPVVSNCAYTKLGSASSFGFGIEEDLYPSGAEAIIGHPAFPKKAINFAADGGYLAWKYPARKIFIDYRPGRYDHELLKDLNFMMRGNSTAYNTLYETYRPEAIIINTLASSAPQGIVSLLSRKIWKLAYFDGTTAILLLNKEEFAPLLNHAEAQAAALAKLEAARVVYAEKVGQGCRAGNPGELIGSGSLFLALNRPAESKAIFSLLLQGNDSISKTWLGLGNSQFLLKEFEAATESLHKAIQLSPHSLSAWISYASACKYAGKTDEQNKAIKTVQQLIEQNKAKNPDEPAPEAELEPEPKTPSIQPLKDFVIPE